MIFHIRAPLPRNGVNRFYRIGEPRIAKTLCGLPVTAHDIRFGWAADAVGKYEPCSECIEIRRQAKTGRDDSCCGKLA